MLTDNFNRPKKPDVSLYHIHIYYEVGASSEAEAKGLASRIAKAFPNHVKEVHEYDKPGGPHAVSNVAVHFGAKGFGEIVQWLLEQGCSGNLPAAVISRGTWPDQQSETGTLTTIPEHTTSLGSPAILVIGRSIYSAAADPSIQGHLVHDMLEPHTR